ncbi:MAG: helicase-associated domain-containing protein [Vallitalea sp.]|jgi:DNA-binding transcriptional MerR regulator|nr:helicase-associated domain-containing protein [Vallitalea sp.]
MALKELLYDLRTESHGMQLPQLVRISGVKTASKRKADMVDALYKYLNVEENILNIWKSINSFERTLISEYVRSERGIDSEDIDEIMKKYNKKKQSSYRTGRGVASYFSEKSKANLFFINGNMASEIYNILKKQLKPIQVEFKPVDINIEEYIDYERVNRKYITIGERFEDDFISIIKLVNLSKFKATKVSQMPNRTAMIKMYEVMKNTEIFYEDQEDIKDVRVIDNTIRLYGVSKLLLENSILQIINGALVLGEHADDFLMMDVADRCRFLLEGYLKSDINELKRINELKLKTEYEGNYYTCRKVVLKYLKQAPIDKWIDIEQLFKFIKKIDRNFLGKIVGDIYTYNDYDHYYYGNQNYWEDEAGRFIEVVLIEYLSSIGIVDLLINEKWDQYLSTTYYRIDYFKLTPLGAHILGMNKNYKVDEIKNDTGLIIQPNYEIIVPDGTKKEVHCIYLDKFAERLSEDAVSMYRISFKSMIMALDNGLNIKEILEYLKKNSHNEIPENILMSLKQWEEDSKRIKIRTVTIVETDDKYLLEELKSYKVIKKDIVNELSHVFEIDSKATNKVKRNIEKKNHFCIIE